MIDRDKIKQALECDDDFLNLLFDQFIVESKESTKHMNRSLEDGNWGGVRGSAHKMLSSTKLLDMPELTGLLEKIEHHAATESQLEDIHGLVNEYNSKVGDIYDELSS